MSDVVPVSLDLVEVDQGLYTDAILPWVMEQNWFRACCLSSQHATFSEQHRAQRTSLARTSVHGILLRAIQSNHLCVFCVVNLHAVRCLYVFRNKRIRVPPAALVISCWLERKWLCASIWPSNVHQVLHDDSFSPRVGKEKSLCACWLPWQRVEQAASSFACDWQWVTPNS